MNLTTVGTAIAKALEGTWRNESGHWSNDRMLIGPAGERVILTAYPPGRITISGAFAGPLHEAIRDDDDLIKQRISVAEHTPPDKIANHVTRRLLPGYRAALAVATERTERRAANETARTELAGKLAAILPGGQPVHNNEKIYFTASGKYARGSMRPMAGGQSVEIDMCLSADHALAVAELLRTLITGERSP